MNTLGFDNDPKDTRVVVAMSGGVDSSVTAALLAEEGYDVIGVTLQLYNHGDAIKRTKACCAGQDIFDAKRVAESISIPHYVLNYESRFRDEVIDVFADSYLRGETPIPCVLCNQTVKFRDLLNTARDLQADALATGHYIRREEKDGKAFLFRAEDTARDQSYFLFATTQEQANFLRFPLGGLPKEEVRSHAARFNLPVADKPDSQDICFVPDGNYASVVANIRPGAIDPGEVVDTSGTVLAEHQGIINFTIGQRRGIGIGGGREPLYVTKIDPQTRRVTVGPASELGETKFYLSEVNWLGEQIKPSGEHDVLVKVRSTQAPTPASLLYNSSEMTAKVTLEKAERAITPGQACVFYRDNRLLGGGWIRPRIENPTPPTP